jgi:DNA-binding response OmpR family regulator
VWLCDWYKKRNQPIPIPVERVRILALSMSLEDRVLLERLGKQHQWELRFTNSPREGFNLVSQIEFELILCDRNQPGYPWREVMGRLAASVPRSCILLVSHVNTDYLCGDVLLQGGYDVLIRPLREEAVLRSIDAAVRFLSPTAGSGTIYQSRHPLNAK